MNDDIYNSIIDIVYDNYLSETMFDSNPKWLEPIPIINMKTGEKFTGARQYYRDAFINKCKTDNEFSEKWGLKMEEKQLSYQERYKIWFKNNFETGMEYNEDITPDFDNDYYEPTPTKLITITYNNEIIEKYE